MIIIIIIIDVVERFEFGPKSYFGPANCLISSVSLHASVRLVLMTDALLLRHSRDVGGGETKDPTSNWKWVSDLRVWRLQPIYGPPNVICDLLLFQNIATTGRWMKEWPHWGHLTRYMKQYKFRARGHCRSSHSLSSSHRQHHSNGPSDVMESR